MENSRCRVLLAIAADAEWQVVASMLGNGLAPDAAPGPVCRLPEFTDTWIVRTGWGKVAASAAVQRAIDAVRPENLLVLGTCGGIGGLVARGEILVVRRACMHDVRPLFGDVEAELHHYTSSADPAAVEAARRVLGCSVLDIATGDRDLSHSEALAVYDRHGTPVVDWESAAIAYVARTNDVRWCIVKGVSDLISNEARDGDCSRAYLSGADVVMRSLLGNLERLVASLVADDE